MTGGAATTRHNRMMKIFIRILELACEVARLLSDASCRKKYKSFNFNVRICGCGVVVPHLTSNYFFTPSRHVYGLSPQNYLQSCAIYEVDHWHAFQTTDFTEVSNE